MVFGRNSNVKEGEKTLKRIIGGKHSKNVVFSVKMDLNGIENKDETWKLIDSEIKQELKDGRITSDDVSKRIDDILLIKSQNSVLVEPQGDVQLMAEKFKILNSGSASIQIPYVKSGVNDALLGQVVFGRNGAVLGSMTEGEIDWNFTELLLVDGGISIKKTGQVVLYKNIEQVVLGDKGFINTVLTIVTKNGENIVIKAVDLVSKAIKKIIEENLVIEIDVNGDDLFKYAELYEKGLLTREEFEMKKAEILGNEKHSNGEESHISKVAEEKNLEKEILKPKFCSNCGTPIEEDSNFCTNCGFKLI